MRHLPKTALVASVLLLLVGCQPPPPEDPTPAAEEPEADVSDPGVVEVVVEDFAFNAPPSLVSGWTTFRMTNAGEEPHFMIFWKLPDGVEFAQYAEFGRMFQDHYDAYFAGDATRQEMLDNVMAGLPEWFADVQGRGGVALTSPGITAETTIRLEPGDYVMECYVVTPEGRFHGSEGMLRPLTVTEETTGLEPPDADITVTLSNYEMEVEGDLTAGEHVVAVHATEQAEGIVLHDVNVARLDPDTSMEEVGSWMSWIDALRNPEPATFLGGADHLSGGATGYFRVTLEPGRYAFVSEGFATQGMVHEFTVE
ncbi:MAG: hypothetical protein ACOC5E_01810 [Acidobacteriota bacterium]